MAKKSIQKNQEPKEIQGNSPDKISKFNNFYGMIAGAIAVLCFGFSIGKWVSNIEHKSDLLKIELNYQNMIIEEKQKWEKEMLNEGKLDKILLLLEKTEGGENESK